MAAMRKKKVRKKAEPKPKSPEELYASAQRALELDDPELARKCLQRAVELAPTSAELAEAYGCLLSEMGRREEALQALRRAVELQPDTGFEKYMYLGQLLEGESAIEASKKGVEVMESALAAMDGEGSAGAAAGVREQLAAGLCSLAEMYMAAAADVSAVADDCQQLLRRAADVHPDSPEPLQTLASLRYELGGMEEALQLLKESMSMWFRPRKAEGSGEGGMEDGEADGEEEGGTAGMAVDGPDGGEAQLPGGWEPAVRKPEADSGEPAEARGDDAREEALPSYEFRYECAKLLVELDRTTDTAIQVLEDLLQENDGVVDVWHTLSLAYYGGGHLEEAQETLDHGQQLAARQGMPPESGMALAFQDLRAAVEDAKTKLGQAHS